MPEPYVPPRHARAWVHGQSLFLALPGAANVYEFFPINASTCIAAVELIRSIIPEPSVPAPEPRVVGTIQSIPLDILDP